MHQPSPSQTLSPQPPLNRHNTTHRLQYLKILSNAPNPVRFDMISNPLVSYIVNGWIMEANQMDNKWSLVSLGTAGTFLDSKSTHERAHFYSCLCHIPPVGCGRLLVAACSALCGSQSALHRDRSEKKTENERRVFSSWHQNYLRGIKSQHFYSFYVAISCFVICVADAKAAKNEE